VKKLQSVQCGEPVCENADLNSQIGLFHLQNSRRRNQGNESQHCLLGLTPRSGRPVRDSTSRYGSVHGFASPPRLATVCAAHPAHSLPSFTLSVEPLPPVLRRFSIPYQKGRRRLRHSSSAAALGPCLCLWWLCCHGVRVFIVVHGLLVRYSSRRQADAQRLVPVLATPFIVVVILARAAPRQLFGSCFGVHLFVVGGGLLPFLNDRYCSWANTGGDRILSLPPMIKTMRHNDNCFLINLIWRLLYLIGLIDLKRPRCLFGLQPRCPPCMRYRLAEAVSKRTTHIEHLRFLTCIFIVPVCCGTWLSFH
jgi:hypothetical protein